MIIRQRNIAAALTGLIAVVCAYALFALIGNVSDRLDRADSQAISRDKAVAENQKALTDANAKVTALSGQIQGLGKEPVVSPLPVAVTGDRGPGPTLGQVAVAIQNYCVANGQCRGPDGMNGADSTVPGPAGADSTVPGPGGSDGENGADSTVPGPKGDKGSDGSNGSDGRGIASITCTDDGRFLFTLTDNTTSTVGDPGTCSTPTPTPEPTP